MGLSIDALENLIGVSNMPIEIEPLNNDQFLVVKETLTRIGEVKGVKELHQTCHVLHKQGHYYITHFKQMYLLDGFVQSTKLNEVDVERLKFVTKLLNEWGLVKVIDINQIKLLDGFNHNIRVLKYDDVDDWILKPRFYNNFYRGNI